MNPQKIHPLGPAGDFQGEVFVENNRQDRGSKGGIGKVIKSPNCRFPGGYIQDGTFRDNLIKNLTKNFKNSENRGQNPEGALLPSA